MNEPSEATHYQIELTSRQVLTALAVLLTCLFAAFFAGVWIGRSAAAERAALELASVGEESRAEGQFDFFSRTTLPSDGDGDARTRRSEEGDHAPRAAAGLGGGSRPAREEMDFGPDPDDEELGATSPSSAEADELPPPEEMGREGRRRRAAARAEAARPELADEPEPEDDTPAVAEAAGAPPAPPPASQAAPAESGFHIQVLATSDRQKAQALVERLVDADFKAFIAPANEGARAVYRVRVGPFPDRALATRQAAELESRWGLESWISPTGP